MGSPYIFYILSYRLDSLDSLNIFVDLDQNI